MTRENAAHERLLDEWVSSYRAEGMSDSFVRDGIISPALWGTSPSKVLFVTKEPNATSGRIFREFGGDLRCEGNAHPWRRLGEWASAIHATASSGSAPLGDVDKSRDDAYRGSAIINLKKLAGSARCNDQKVARIASRDRERIWNQLNLISPDWVVLCGVSRIIGEAWGAELLRGAEIWSRKPRIIAVPHPSGRYERLKVHEMLQQRVRTHLRLS